MITYSVFRNIVKLFFRRVTFIANGTVINHPAWTSIRYLDEGRDLIIFPGILKVNILNLPHH